MERTKYFCLRCKAHKKIPGISRVGRKCSLSLYSHRNDWEWKKCGYLILFYHKRSQKKKYLPKSKENNVILVWKLKYSLVGLRRALNRWVIVRAFQVVLIYCNKAYFCQKYLFEKFFCVVVVSFLDNRWPCTVQDALLYIVNMCTEHEWRDTIQWCRNFDWIGTMEGEQRTSKSII